MSDSTPFFLAIAGASASGKTTLVSLLLQVARQENLDIVPVDAYYHDQSHLSIAEREQTNYDHPDSLEFDLLKAHLDSLRDGRSVDVPVYDYTVHNRAEKTRTVHPKPIIVVEGILTFYDPDLRQRFDHCVFIETDTDVCLQRRLARDVKERGRTMESVVEQWERTVLPMYQAFCLPGKSHADQLVDGTNLTLESAHALLRVVNEKIGG